VDDKSRLRFSREVLNFVAIGGCLEGPPSLGRVRKYTLDRGVAVVQDFTKGAHVNRL